MTSNMSLSGYHNPDHHSSDYQVRLSKVRERIDSAGLDALIVTEPHNIFYLSGSNGGYTGARTALIVSRDKSILLIDSRYIEETKTTAIADSIQVWALPGYADILNIVNGSGDRMLGFEATHITVKQFERLSDEFSKLINVKLVGTMGIVEMVRETKDLDEIAKIRAAAKIADLAFDYITGLIKPGASEKEIALELDYFMLRNGAECVSFDTIVASGKNSAVPHATPSAKKIALGDFVKLDFGAVVDGYHSDMTRTVVAGKADDKQLEIYFAVKEAQERALVSVKAGLICEDIDKVARDVVAEKGFGECFVHNLGHGVGLQIHETPSLGKNCKTSLQAGMVVTVEPGVYVNGFGGVRIEDLVVVTETGCEILSKSTKELLEL